MSSRRPFCVALVLVLGACEGFDIVSPAEDSGADALTASIALASAFTVGALAEAAAGTPGSRAASPALGVTDAAPGGSRLPPRDEPERRRGEEGAPNGGGLDLFDRLAAGIDGFGGLYRTAPCSVVVVLVEGADRESAIRIVHAAVSPLVARPCPAGIRVSAAAGQFTYVELHRFLVVSRPLLQLRGVTGARIDYQANRLVFSVASREAARAVLEGLDRLGIPPRAATFEGASPDVPTPRSAVD